MKTIEKKIICTLAGHYPYSLTEIEWLWKRTFKSFDKTIFCLNKSLETGRDVGDFISSIIVKPKINNNKMKSFKDENEKFIDILNKIQSQGEMDQD